jgi:DNA helicase HerA-like ATPase
MSQAPKRIGVVVRGSLAGGLETRLDPDIPVEEVRAGRFVVVEGAQHRFFGMVTDVGLAASSPEALMRPPAGELQQRMAQGSLTYSTATLRTTIALARDDAADEAGGLLPVRTVPVHFAPVHEADSSDVQRVFGVEGAGANFQIGQPIELDAPVCLDLERFCERSNGIFGKSGTGKTFLTRLVLAGIIKHDVAVNLVFDMHSEYGWSGTTEDRSRATVSGLSGLFPGQVEIFTIDPVSSHRRRSPARPIRIPTSAIEVEDVLLLSRELNLGATAEETIYLLAQKTGRDWLTELKDRDAKELAEDIGAHAGALAALKRKMAKLLEDCKEFVVDRTESVEDGAARILECLVSGKHVVLEFGQHSLPRQYMLVANILTRRIHQAYAKRTEESLSAQGSAPKPLVITIEEAHKFLAPGLADQTIFGTIARELRKYRVTLLVVDQRPSGIDSEVLSQVGTKLICLLDDDKDVDAVLSGMAGRDGLRQVLAGLETKQQALVLGHAAPMPVVVRTRTYDDDAFRQWIGRVDEPMTETQRTTRMATEFPD